MYSTALLMLMAGLALILPSAFPATPSEPTMFLYVGTALAAMGLILLGCRE